MSLYFFFIAFILLMSYIIYNLNKYLCMNKKINLEKKIPFECGFNPISKFNLPFSMPFFLISLLFLIFDIEITMMIPLIMYLKYLNFLIIIIINLLFLYTMLTTLIMEWILGYLNWMF
uniref:NADH-ubiquinone oxidoreductase chain 3 n=1 Tax=Melipona scutellaris TaxID=263364 RepID=A0A0B4U295_9HYME|nr:NADH dehydrogenase subunit 3 [Melipona scutellaris]AJC00749.1 NADH dehydrogenase subunit 3 [Melipona scutellaris]